MTSDAFHEVFSSAVSTTHRVFVTRSAEAVVLNLTSTIDDIRVVLQEVSPGLAEDLPKGKDLRITLAKRTQLPLIWDWVHTANRIIDSLYLVAIALIGLGLLIAPFRWRSLALLGWSTAAAGIVCMLALTVTRQVLLNRVPDPVYRSGAGSAWNAMSRELFVLTIVLCAVGAATAVLARWTDNNGGTAVYPVAARRALHSARDGCCRGCRDRRSRTSGPSADRFGICGSALALARTRTKCSLGALVARIRARHGWSTRSRQLGLRAFGDHEHSGDHRLVLGCHRRHRLVPCATLTDARSSKRQDRHASLSAALALNAGDRGEAAAQDAEQYRANYPDAMPLYRHANTRHRNTHGHANNPQAQRIFRDHSNTPRN